MRIAFLVFALVAAVSSNSFGAVRTWDGGGADDNWRTAGNWVDDIAPVSGDDLVFPAVAAKYTSSNNMPFGSTVRSMTFEGGTYTISGSPLLPQRLSDGLTVLDGTQTINIVLQLTAPETFTSSGAAAVGIVAGVVLGSN